VVVVVVVVVRTPIAKATWGVNGKTSNHGRALPVLARPPPQFVFAIEHGPGSGKF